MVGFYSALPWLITSNRKSVLLIGVGSGTILFSSGNLSVALYAQESLRVQRNPTMATTSPYAVSLPQQVNIMHLYQEAKRLFQSKLYRSVESLTLLCISASSKAETTLRVKSASATVPLVDLYELLGDAIFHQQYFKRAISYYRLAVQHKHPVGIKISSTNRHSNWIINPADGQLQFKLARSLYESGDMAQAIVEIESIPPSFLDLEILTTLGQWYKQANRAADSLRVYKQAYALAPYAIELLEIIATLKGDEAELTKAVKEYHSSRFQEHLVTSSQTTTDSASGISASTFFQAPTIAASPPEWLTHLIQGLSCHHRLESEKALDYFQRLLALFPKNVFVMRLTAHAWSFHEIEDQAMSLYKQIQRIDKLYSTEMDRYAALLYRRCVQSSSGTGNAREDEVLQRLATELMDATQASSPEALVSVAYFCLMRKEYEAAASFVERALSLPQVHQQHAEAWRCRGHLRGPTALNTPSAALVDFLHANAMEKDLASFVGIVETNMAMGKFRDAATAAKEMVLLYPKSARALYTLGTVMAKSPQGVRESIKAFSKALRLHPRLLDATLALCTTYLSLGHHTEAEACATQALKYETHPRVLILLAKALSNQNKHKEALDQLRMCCSLTAGSAVNFSCHCSGSVDLTQCHNEAMGELERIEGILKEENGLQLQQEEDEAAALQEHHRLHDDDDDGFEDDDVDDDDDGGHINEYAYLSSAHQHSRSYGLTHDSDEEDGGDSSRMRSVRRGQLFGGHDDDDE